MCYNGIRNESKENITLTKDKEKVIDLNKEVEVKEPVKKAKAKAKKLTNAQVTSQLKKTRAVKKVGVTINGDEFYYEIDTVPTATKKEELIRSIKETVLFLLGEDENDAKLISAGIENDKKFAEEVQVISGVIVVAEIMRIFSDMEVGNTLEEKQQFVLDMSDIGVFTTMAENIPEALFDIVVETTNEISAEMEEIMAQKDNLEKQIIELEQEATKIQEKEDQE